MPSLPSRRRSAACYQRRRSRRLEPLEPRRVLDSTVVFSELMYHPPDDGELEWIELHNEMAVDMDISRWSLSGGVEFEFPEETVIRGGSLIVVAVDPPTLETAQRVRPRRHLLAANRSRRMGTEGLKTSRFQSHPSRLSGVRGWGG